MEWGNDMMKPRSLIGAIGALLIFSICNSPTNNNTVDTISSATLHNELKFNVPITVTNSSATIEWQEYYADQGSGYFFYGTSLANLTKRNVTSSERSATVQKIILTGLTPNTTYYIRLVTTAPDQGPNGDTATIKTLN
jgi:hypothetical protein